MSTAPQVGRFVQSYNVNCKFINQFLGDISSEGHFQILCQKSVDWIQDPRKLL